MLALNSMYRAKNDAIMKAAEDNIKMPVWKGGKMIFIDAKERLKEIQTS